MLSNVQMCPFRHRRRILSRLWAKPVCLVPTICRRRTRPYIYYRGDRFRCRNNCSNHIPRYSCLLRSRAGMAASCFEQPRREVQRKAERRRIVSVSKSSWLGGPVVFCELLTSRGRNRNEGKEGASTCGSSPQDSNDQNHGTRLA